jgi:hypothetical protein
VVVEIAVSPDLAASLAAAAADRLNIHGDLCSVYTESPEYGCSCGVPKLLADLAALLGVGESDWRAVLYASSGPGFA